VIDSEREAEAILPCNENCHQDFPECRDAHWSSCAAYHRAVVAAAIQSAYLRGVADGIESVRRERTNNE
jgi:hypothetical protein